MIIVWFKAENDISFPIWKSFPFLPWLKNLKFGDGGVKTRGMSSMKCFSPLKTGGLR